MIITATYTGRNGSLGYITGTTYELRILDFRRPASIERLDGTGRCIYTGLHTFLASWTNITVKTP